ncbi:MAG: penicillin-binding transpeptidase domain-containing protein [Bacillota bacterium]|nr:penicillin-binding transpeptidase domain-containing protein [Bacillota bacterium]
MIYKRKAIKIFLLMCFIFLMLIIRIVCIMFYDSKELSTKAELQYDDTPALSDINYMLFDYNGRQLLDYKNKYYVVIDIGTFHQNNFDKNSNDLYSLIYILKNYNNDYDLLNINNTENNSLTYEIDEDTYDKLKNLKGVKGFYTYMYSAVDRSASWKIENILTDPKRLTDKSFKTLDSIEMQVYNKTKDNKYIKERFAKDVNGNISSKGYIMPQNNVNVRLTFDKNIEDKVKDTLNSDKYKNYSQIGVIIMDSSSGNILAMVNKNDNDANANIGAATENGYVPGSIFKIIVDETGIQNNSISLTKSYACLPSSISMCKGREHGSITVAEALAESCNNVFAKLGEDVGYKNFIASAKSQGLFNKVFNFDSEAIGDYVEPIKNAGGSRLISIGQNMRITPIQAISIANTVANDGVYVKPRLIDAYVDDNNNEITKLPSQKKTIFSKNTADIMKTQMIQVVKKGTAYLGNIDNIEIGGKTGTSTRIDGSNYCSDGWFISFFKLKDKYYSMVVFVKNIDVDNEEGGTTAVPIFKDIVLNISKN